MNINAMRRLLLELLQRQPAAFADLVNGELPGVDQHQPDDPANDRPEWCQCGHCVVMPTQEENISVALECGGLAFPGVTSLGS